MERDIKFISFDPKKSDFDSKDGEITVATNLFRNIDGSFGPGMKAETTVRLPEGYEAIAVHETCRLSNIIVGHTTTDNIVSVLWAEMKMDVSEQDLVDIGVTSEIRCVETAENIIVLGTNKGIIYLVWDGQKYILVDLAKSFPTIEFGLRKAGVLSCTETFVIEGVMTNNSVAEQAGNGASRPHPSAETERLDYTATFKGIAKAFTDAVDHQVLSKGYFHQPFFIRYTLRMADGTHILPSAPILMLPSVLPPCLGLNTTTDSSGKCTITTDFSPVKFFELTYRMPNGMPSAITSIVSAIDIFVSPAIPTFDETRLDDGYITTYFSTMEARNTVRIRGTRTLSRTDERIFEGHYADSGDNYADHYLSQSTAERKAYMVHPNVNFHQQIATMDDFHKIASIPCTCTDGFEKVGIMTSDLRAIQKEERLIDLQMSHCRILPSALLANENCLLTAVKGTIPPQPFPLAAPDTSATATLRIIVYLRIGGMTERITNRYKSNVPLAESIPRYVYYPDPRALLMTISDGQSIYSLPLEPHATLHGAYHYGGTDTEYLPEPTPENQLPETQRDAMDTKSTLLITRPGNIFAFSERCNFTQSIITALCKATKAPKSGVFGRHNIYAFTLNGIWMLEYSAGAVKSTQQISTLGVKDESAIADTGQDVFFASCGKLLKASGSEIIEVSETLDAMNPHLIDLPHADELLDSFGITAEISSTEEYFRSCELLYDPMTNSILAYRTDKDYSLVYNHGQDAWMTADISVGGKIKTSGGYLATGTSRRTLIKIFRTEGEDDEMNTFLLTRPIKLGSPLALHDIRKFEILGYFRSRNVRLAAYGSHDMRHWHLMTSSDRHFAEDFNTTSYRMLRICVAARLAPYEYLHGIKIIADD